MINQILQIVMCFVIGVIAVTIGPPLLVATLTITAYALLASVVLFVLVIIGACLYKLYKRASDKLE